MTRQYIDVNGYWAVNVYHNVEQSDAKEIVNALQGLRCDPEDIEDAVDVIGGLNKGFTYTCAPVRMSIIVITRASSRSEYENTIAHECDHLKNTICAYYGVDHRSEDASYLLGDLVGEMTKWMN